MTEVPPPLAGPAVAFPRRPVKWLAITASLALCGLLLLLYFHRPEGQFFFPRCTFHSATGLLCPGCGGLRATHALLHGRLAEAVQSNALLVLGLPAMLAFLARQRLGLRPTGISPHWVWILFALVVAFGIARNLPFPAARWLSP